jgi:hypothetical protein
MAVPAASAFLVDLDHVLLTYVLGAGASWSKTVTCFQDAYLAASAYGGLRRDMVQRWEALMRFINGRELFAWDTEDEILWPYRPRGLERRAICNYISDSLVWLPTWDDDIVTDEDALDRNAGKLRRELAALAERVVPPHLEALSAAEIFRHVQGVILGLSKEDASTVYQASRVVQMIDAQAVKYILQNPKHDLTVEKDEGHMTLRFALHVSTRYPECDTRRRAFLKGFGLDCDDEEQVESFMDTVELLRVTCGPRDEDETIHECMARYKKWYCSNIRSSRVLNQDEMPTPELVEQMVDRIEDWVRSPNPNAHGWTSSLDMYNARSASWSSDTSIIFARV